MQTLPFHDELLTAFRDLLVNDATLTTTVPAKHVWTGNDLSVDKWPAIVFRVINDGPVRELTAPGKWRPTLRLSVTGRRRSKDGKASAAEIAARVVTLWTIGVPGSVTPTIQTTNFLITHAHLQDSAYLEQALRLEDDGEALVTYSQLWRVTLAQRTQSNG